jgi:hypothetical protein
MSILNLSTPNKMYEYSVNYGLGYVKEKVGISNFELLYNDLQSDESIYCVFIGERSNRKTEHLGWASYAVTNKRIILAQKVAWTVNVLSIPLDNIIGVTKSGPILGLGFIEIEAFHQELWKIITTKDYFNNIYNAIQSSLTEARSKPQQENIARSNPQQNNPIDRIKEYKELLDMGIITEEEFKIKKKELLGL